MQFLRHTRITHPQHVILSTTVNSWHQCILQYCSVQSDLSVFFSFFISFCLSCFHWNCPTLKHSVLYYNFDCTHSSRQHYSSYMKHLILKFPVLCQNSFIKLDLIKFSSLATKAVSFWYKLQLQKKQKSNMHFHFLYLCKMQHWCICPHHSPFLFSSYLLQRTGQSDPWDQEPSSCVPALRCLR